MAYPIPYDATIVSDDAAQTFAYLVQHDGPVFTTEIQAVEPAATFEALSELATLRLITIRHTSHDFETDWFAMIEVDKLDRHPNWDGFVQEVWARGNRLLNMTGGLN